MWKSRKLWLVVFVDVLCAVLFGMVWSTCVDLAAAGITAMQAVYMDFTRFMLLFNGGYLGINVLQKKVVKDDQ